MTPTRAARTRRRLLVAATALAVGVAAPACVVPPDDPDGPWVLLFTRTEGFDHSSIDPAAQALGVEMESRGWSIVASDSPELFRADRLATFDAVVFLSTTGDVLDPPQEAALRAWVEGGGGWVGVHAALDTEDGWPWYATLAGTRFAAHPAPQQATVRVEDATHPSTAHLPTTWVRTDEWYDTQTNPRGSVHVLATVDESTYAGGSMGTDHPIVWCDTVGAGQSFVTAMGHLDEHWSDPVFVDHVAGGIESVTSDTCG